MMNSKTNDSVFSLKDIFKKLKIHFDQFLFQEAFTQQLGLFRFLLCATLLYIAIFRQLNVDQYGPHSLIPSNEAFNLFSDYYRPAFPLFFWSDEWASVVHLSYIGLLVLATLGFSNRILMIATWLIAQGFIQRNFSILFGADVIGTLLLFYLAFTRCHDSWSLKNLIFKSKKTEPIHPSDTFFELLSRIFVRLLQLQVMTIYVYTGFEKLKGNTWWDGTALWTVLVNPQFTSYNLVFLKSFPLFFAVGTFVTIIFEVYFAPMVSFKKTRPYWLMLGVFFHLMIGVLLGLMTFSMVMIASYVLFLDSLVLNRLKHQVKGFFIR